MTEPTDKPLLDEQQLDEYLKGDSSVSRQYRQLPGEDVPPSLDRLVLRQAEDAVKRPSRPAWMRWTAPIAVAASAVLVVSIVVETGLKDETMVTSQAVQPKQAADAAAPVETRMSEESAGAPPSPPKVEVPPPVVFVEPVTEPRALADMHMVPADVAPTFAPSPATAPEPELAPASEPERKALARQPAAIEPAAPEIRGQIATAEQEDKTAAALADASREKSARDEISREQEQSATQRATRSEQDQAAGARGAAPAAVLSYSRPISATATDNVATLKRTYTDPEAWLKDIRQLRKDNKPEEADSEWRRFRETFPDYEVAETDAARAAKK
jgi:hypothetical protein